jgi:hypothetical protein
MHLGNRETEREFRWGGEGLERYTRSFTRRFETGAQASLRVENQNGFINVRTHNQPAIVIEVVAEFFAESAAAADAEARRIEDGISQDGSRVDIRTPELRSGSLFGRSARVNYEIRVPADTEVWASCHNGPILVNGVRRPAHVQATNGDVTVEDVAAEVNVESRNGRIKVARCSGPASIAGANGPITVEEVASQLTVETRNGPTEISEAGAGVRAGTTNGPIRYRGRVNGDFDLQATNGGIRLAVTPDSRFEIDAESSHGSVRSDLPVRDQPLAEGGAALPKVKIRTTNGSIRLTEAEG